MNNIENKVVEMKFDNSQFEAAVAKTMDTLDKFKEKLNFEGAGKGLDKLGKASGNYQYTLNDIGQSLDSLNGKFSTMGNIGRRVLENLTDSAYKFVSKGIGGMISGVTSGGLSRAMNLEQAKFQLQGIFKDANEVKRVIYDDILPELQGTPFSLDQAAVVMGQLAASGKTSSEQIKRATRGIAGLAAMTNHSFADVGRIFTKVAGNGAMMAQELNQLSGYGVNAAADLAKFFQIVEKDASKATPQTLEDMAQIKEAFGEFNEANIREAASKRMLHYGSMAAAMDVLYGEHAKKSTTMYTGALEDLKAALARVGAEPAAVGLEFLRDAFNALVPAVDAVNAVLKPFTSATKDVIEINGEAAFGGAFAGSLSKKVQDLGHAFQSMFVTLDKDNNIMRFTKDNIKELQLEMRHIPEWVEYLNSGVSEGDAIMNPRMWKILNASTNSFVNILTAAGKVLKAIGTGIAAAFPKITLKTFSDIAGSVEKFTSHLILSEESLERLKWITQGVFTPLGLLFSALVSLVKGAIKVFSELYDILHPVIQTILSFGAAIGQTVVGIGQFIRDIINEAGGLAAIIGGVVLKIAEFFKLDKALELFKKAFTALAGVFDSVGGKTNSFFSSIVPKVKEFAASIAEFLHLKEITASFQSFFSTIKAGLAKILHIDQVKNAIKDLVDAFKQFFDKDKFFSGLLEDLKTFIQWIQEMVPLEDILTRLGNAFSFVSDKASELTGRPASLVQRLFISLASSIKKFFTSTEDVGLFTQLLRDVIHPYDTFLSLQQKFNKAVVPTLQMLGNLIPLAAGFDTWGDMVAAAGNKIGGAVKAFLSFLGVITSIGTSKMAQSSEEFRKTLGGFFDSLKSKSIDGASSAAEKFKKFADTLSTAFTAIGDVLGKWISEHSNSDIKRFIASLILLAMAFSYIRSMRGLFYMLKDATVGFAAFRSIGEAIRSTITSFKVIPNVAKEATRFAGLSLLMISFAGSVYLISQCDTDKLKIAAAVMLIAAGVLTVLMVALSKISEASIKKGPKAILTLHKLSVAIAGLGLALLGIAGAIAILVKAYQSAESPGEFWKPVLAIVGIMAGFAVLSAVVSSFPKLSTSISKIGLGFLGLASAVSALTKPVIELSEAAKNGTDLKAGVNVILEIMLGIAGISAAASLLSSPTALLAFALDIAVITAAIYVMIPALMLLSKVDVSAGINTISTLMAFFGIFALLTALASSKFLGGLKGLLAASAYLVVATIAVVEMSKSLISLASLDETSLDRAMGALSGIMILLGAIALISGVGGSLAGAASMGGVAAIAIGLSMLCDSLAALGQLSLGGLAKAFIGLGEAIIGLGAAIVIFGALSKFILGPKEAASIMLMGVGIFFLASAISTLAGMPFDVLLVSILGIVGAMAAAALVMAAFSALGPGLILVAAAFALVGVACILVGGGIYIATLALATLIPLIETLGTAVSGDALSNGLDILKEVAKGLGEAFLYVAAGAGQLAWAILGLGVAVIVTSIGIALFGVACMVAALGILSVVGALSVLFSFLQQFPSLLDTVVSGLSVIGGGISKLFDGFLDRIRKHYSDAQKEAQIGNQTLEDTMDQKDQQREQKMGESGKRQVEIVKSTKQAMTTAYSEGEDPFTNTTATWLGDTEMVMDEQGNVIGDKSEWLKTLMASKFGEGGMPFTDGTQMDMDQLNALLDSEGTTAFDKTALINAMMGEGFASEGSPLDISKYVNGFDKQLDEAASSGQTGGQNISTSTGQGVNRGKAAVDASTRGVMQSVKTILNSVDGKPAGKNTATGYAAGERSGIGAVSSAAGSLANAGVPPSRYSSAYDVGSGICDGIVAGIRGGIGLVKTIAYNAGNAAAAAAKSGAAVNSPSKKTIPVGEAICEGIVVGINRTYGLVKGAAYALGDNATRYVTDAMRTVASIFDSDMDFTPTITPVVDLTNVRQSVDGINTMFGDTFGLTTPYSSFNAAQMAALSMNQTNDGEFDAITKLAKEIGAMNETMNARQMVNNINIEGSEDPNAFADALTRRFKLNVRTM